VGEEITKNKHEQSSNKHLIELNWEKEEEKRDEKTYRFEQVMETKN
jgi:hypothetical protein